MATAPLPCWVCTASDLSGVRLSPRNCQHLIVPVVRVGDAVGNPEGLAKAYPVPYSMLGEDCPTVSRDQLS